MKLLPDMMLSEVLSYLGLCSRIYRKFILLKDRRLYEQLIVDVFSDRARHNKYREFLNKVFHSKSNRRLLIKILDSLVKVRPKSTSAVYTVLFKVLYGESFDHHCKAHRDRVQRLLNMLVLLSLISPYDYYDNDIVVLTPLAYMFYHHFSHGIPRDYRLFLSFPGDIVLKGNGLFFNEYVKVYHEYIVNYWEPPVFNSIALFTPCSNVKPIPRSFMNVKIDGILKKYGLEKHVDRYIVSEPLVLVPYRFAYYFPAAHYDYHPSMVTPEERKIYVELLREIIERKIARRYNKIVYHLPRFHKRVFEEAINELNVEIVYVPYNVYYLPELKKALLCEVRE